MIQKYPTQLISILQAILAKLQDQNPYPINIKDIMIDLGITMDGVYRETVLKAGVYQYVEKYMRNNWRCKRWIILL